jgi:aryl-phospho-beta-D-glucosidase BglC (GH1 family)
MPNPPVALDVYKYSGGSYQSSTYDVEFMEWSAPNLTCDPGEALFVHNYGTNFTWTFVGEVPTGTQTKTVNQGFNLISSIIPKTGTLQGQLGYTPSVGTSDTVYKYVNNGAGGGGYQTFVWDGEFLEWSPFDPTIEVGVGFWLVRGAASIPWTQVFNVGS